MKLLTSWPWRLLGLLVLLLLAHLVTPAPPAAASGPRLPGLASR